MPVAKRWNILLGMMLVAALSGMTAGCRSDAYYQDRAVQRARAYLLEHATELSAEQLYFVKFNRPVLLVGQVLPGGNQPGEEMSEVLQICVAWRIPGEEKDYLVFGSSSGSMEYWYPNRLIRKTFETFKLPILSAMQLARDYARNYLYEEFSVAEFNRIRFDFPSVIETNFPLVLDPSGSLDQEEIEKARAMLSSQPQLSLVWKLDEPGKCAVFCGTGKRDLTGWSINFAGKMKTEELDASTVDILKTPENAQTPIELPETKEQKKETSESKPFSGAGEKPESAVSADESLRNPDSELERESPPEAQRKPDLTVPADAPSEQNNRAEDGGDA